MPRLALGAVILAASAVARAEGPPGAEVDPASLRQLSQPVTSTWRVLGSLAFGDGLRFNNPFRLGKELGSDEKSVSLTRGYVDLGAAVALGRPSWFQHGAAVHLSLALGGVPEQVLTPSYFVALRGPRRGMVFGRLGPAIILSPDPNVGGELGVGGAYFFTAGIAASAELVGDLYYGAATPSVSYSVIPIISAQLGVLIDYEVLP